jgi:hypothetical protein
MEQLQKIQTWLDNPNRDYFEGISLLNQATRNKTLIRNLSRKQNKYNADKLIYELKKEASIPTKIITTNKQAASVPDVALTSDKMDEDSELKKAAPAPSAAFPIVKGHMTIDETKEAVEKLEIALGKKHNKKGILSNSLRDFAPSDNIGRKKVLDEIDVLNNDMNEIRGKLAYYEKHGSLPPIVAPKSFDIKENDIPDDPVAIKQMLLNERSNRAKLKRKLDDPSTDKNKLDELKARFTSKDNLIAEIERRLNGSN